ncbi:uncharacterized protein M6B38_290090 [Iris pallida]|uniref:AMP-activated protein kinase glycogen-binding domain-containing protein n=1 Tax=Iris pallida TaxID=29817 RepID=A0AAX6HX22_IRIPA|nr:uncharacterized protein M6B38_290090 [Iris pallida]
MAIPMAATLFFPNPNPRFPPNRPHVPPRSRTPSLLLGFDRRRNRGRGGGVLEVRRRRRGKGKEEEDAFSALEAEVLDFMEGSENPDAFPTKDELVRAGRKDLAEAIARTGGWLAIGWDSKDPTSSSSLEEEAGVEEEASPYSGTGGLIEKDGGEEAGIGGILSRLERERNLSFGVGSREKGVCGEVPSRKINIGRGDAVGGIEKSDVFTSSDFGLSRQSGQVCFWKGTAEYVNVKNSAPQMWRRWSLERAGNPVTEFEAAEIVPDEAKIKSNIDFTSDGSLNEKMSKEAQSVSKVGDKRLYGSYDAKENGQNQLQVRLKHLESELSSTLHLLRSGTNGCICHKGQDSSLEELHMLLDAWEFKETEIMRARNKLRSTRAKLAVLEGKMALEIIKAQKMMGENRKRFDAAKKALRLLRSVCIVWPNSASEVLLAGSFDGWTSQRRMERSKAGIFSLQLKLYPGRYEIKFIVDGEWRIDPLRPVVDNNGHQNNLLMVS